jgi:hypothetical protein
MKHKARASRPSGPKTLTGSKEAKRQAAVVLEVLSGLRGPTEGSQAMGVSLSRYYQLETRALQGLITALEPRPKGRQRTAEQERDVLERDKRRLERDVARLQALLRAAERSVGIPPSPKPAKGSKLRGKSQGKRVRRTTVVRARKAIEVLRRDAEPTETSALMKNHNKPATKTSAGGS